MGRITPSFRQLYEETISELKMELQAALVDLGHKSAFDLLLKEAWNSEQAAMGNSTLPTVCDKLNIMASIHNRKLIAWLMRELNERDSIFEKFEARIISLEDQINHLSLEIKGLAHRNKARRKRAVYHMDRSIGWLLDVSIEQNRATIWIKTSEGVILKLIDNYQPNFYVLPKDENTGADLFQILSQQSIVKKVEWEDKFTDLFDYDGYGMKKLICVYPESILYYKTLLKSLEKDPRVVQLFNTDLSHVQQYLFTKLKIEPTSKVEVQYDKNESRLIKITKINDEDGIAPPHFQFFILKFTQHPHRIIWVMMSMTRSLILEPDINKNQKSYSRAARIIFSALFLNMFWLKIQIFSFLQTSIVQSSLSLIICLSE